METAPARSFKFNKLRFIANLVRESLFIPMSGTQHQPVAPPDGSLAVTWIGHSSFLLESATAGSRTRILIDPVFASFLIFLKRRRKPGIRLRDLPPIDIVLLTHAHMDHLNLPSLRGILRNNRRLKTAPPIVVVPKGVEDLVATLGFREVRTLETWQSTVYSPAGSPAAEINITMTPAQHWGARLFSDTWRGYGGYFLTFQQHTLFHCGDSAYFPGFAEIGRRLHPDIALLPIGAYYPDSFRSVHTSPEDALRAFHDLGSNHFIPMHHGTFRLSLEPMSEPVPRLLKAAQQQAVAERMLPLEEGRTHIFPAFHKS